ncbi:hypothetical protein QP794_15825 [Paenibacillus sp. UMB7766-LJ446]|uniref:hypothetical protein n=1 Tax=Paenibacillus sp. UMB7766-LJ446 TaxID=3046313 RepID=UPI00254B0334|nr:hypothetical protein [Paenibacillus sp. UMB7766-LJ446]MDK8191556.1 hypothetical protein [Paenibacillus sp. UMB7766-LJ446]
MPLIDNYLLDNYAIDGPKSIDAELIPTLSIQRINGAGLVDFTKICDLSPTRRTIISAYRGFRYTAKISAYVSASIEFVLGCRNSGGDLAVFKVLGQASLYVNGTQNNYFEWPRNINGITVDMQLRKCWFSYQNSLEAGSYSVSEESWTGDLPTGYTEFFLGLRVIYQAPITASDEVNFTASNVVAGRFPT